MADNEPFDQKAWQWVNQAQVNQARAERDAALAALGRVRALHRQAERQTGTTYLPCAHCWLTWPCPTAAAMDGPGEGGPESLAEEPWTIRCAAGTAVGDHMPRGLALRCGPGCDLPTAAMDGPDE